MKPKIQFLKRLLRWPIEQEPGLGSTPTNSESTIQSREQKQSNIPLGDGLLLTCSNLLYSDYLEIMQDKKEAPANWEDILQEYSSLIKTEKSTNVFDLLKKINFAAFKLTAVNEITLFMKKYGWDEEFSNTLAELGFDYIEECEGEDLLRKIFLVETEAKSFFVLLNQYHAEYKRMVPEELQDETRQEIDYLKELAILSKFIGHRIKPNEIYVIEFCAIVNTFIEHNKARNNHELGNNSL